MRRETVLAGGVAAVVVATVLFIAIVPGAIAMPEEDRPHRPGDLSIREVTIAPGTVSGGSATLHVDMRITHRGNAIENATLEVRAISLQSGLVRATKRVPVESVTEDGETRIVTDLTVPRSGGYRIETILYQDGRRIETGDTEVQGVGSLTPAYADSPVRFHQFVGPGTVDFPAIEYAVVEVSDERATLELTTFLTNSGDAPADDLRVVFKIRQSDSNIVADTTTTSVGSVSPGETATPTGQVTVPDGYNYYVEAHVWKGDTLIATARSVANLNPDPDDSIDLREDPDEDGGLRVGEFERTREADGPGAGGEPTTTISEGAGAPGFGVGVAIVAVLVLAVIGRRYHD